MKKLLLILLCSSTLATTAQNNTTSIVKQIIKTDGVVGYIDSEKLLTLMPERVAAATEVENFAKSLEAQLAEMIAEYEKEVKIYKKNKWKYSETEKQEKINQITTLEKTIQTFQQDAQRALEAKEKELLEPIISKAKDAIKYVGLEGGYTYIYDSNASPIELVYERESIDNAQSVEWQGNGSGFFISKSGYIVTNNHVIDGASEIEVEFKYKNEEEGFNAKIVKVDKTNDLAIIKIDDSEFSNLSDIPYNFKTRSVDIGTEIFALGYPMALSLMGKDIKFTDGKISSKTGLGGDITTYQIQVPIQPGNSGGPLFDFKGNLIGITSSGINRKLDLTENVNYAIKTSYLLHLIDVLPETITLPSSTQLASKPLTEQIKILSDYVVLIKVK